MTRNQSYAVQGTVRIVGQNHKFSVKVSENVGKGIQSKDPRTREQAFNSLVTRVLESINKKSSQKGGGTALGSGVAIKERDFTISNVRYI
jgi:hypothetical protein